MEKKNLNNFTEQSHEEKLRKLCEQASSKAEWVTMSEDQINDFMFNFIEFSDENNVEWDKFTYEVFDYDYYKEKFPKFDDSIIDILVKCSEKKIYKDDKVAEKTTRKIGLEDLVVKFK